MFSNRTSFRFFFCILSLIGCSNQTSKSSVAEEVPVKFKPSNNRIDSFIEAFKKVREDLKSDLFLDNKEKELEPQKLKWIFSSLSSGELANSFASQHSVQAVSELSEYKNADDILKKLQEISSNTLSFQNNKRLGFVLRLNDSFKTHVNNFFIKNMNVDSISESLFFKEALLAEDNDDQKSQKRMNLQKVFEDSVAPGIDLVITPLNEAGNALINNNVKTISSLNQEFVNVFVMQSVLEDLKQDINVALKKSLLKLYDIDPSLKTKIAMNDTQPTNLKEISVRALLDTLIPQGDLNSVNLSNRFNKDKLNALLNKPSPHLASDIVSTRNSRVQTGRISLNNLSINGAFQDLYFITNPSYISFQGKIENEKVDYLTGLCSIRLSDVTIGSTASVHMSNPRKAEIFLSKSFDYDVFIELKTAINDQQGKFALSQSYTCGLDLSLCSPFVEIETIGQNSLRFFGLDFGNAIIKTDEGEIRIFGVCKTSFEKLGDTVMLGGLTMKTHHGTSFGLNASVGNHVSGDIFVEFIK
jgi:hypothetical protein